jgi:hypothetical protein
MLLVELSSATEVRRNGVIVEFTIEKRTVREAVTRGSKCGKLNTLHG